MIYKKLKNNINASALVDIDGSIKEQVDANSLAIRQNTDKIAELNTNVENSNATMGELSTKVDDAVAKVDGYEQRIAANEQGIIDVNQRIDNLPEPDFSNYYTKQEVDSSQQAQDAIIATKVDEQFVNDAIAAIPGTDLSPYYTSAQVDEKFPTKQYVADNYPSYTWLNNNVVKLAGAQTITGQKTFSAGEEQFKLKRDGQNPANYFGFYAGNTRIGYMGFPSSANNNMEINNQATDGDLVLSATKTQIHNPLELGTVIRAGYGAGTIKLTPEDNSTKIINMYDSDIGESCYFTFDMGNKGTVRGLKQPENPNEAATKIYVDNKFNSVPQPDLTPYYTSTQVDGLLANKADSSQIQPIIQKNSEQDTQIANNLQKIEANTTQIQQLIAENEKQIHIVFEIQDTQTYEKGSQGFKGNQWYLSLVDGALGSETSNTTKWKPINYETEVDLSGYYNKLETNDLLSPLEGRLTSIEGKNQEQDVAIAANASTLNQKADRSQLNNYVLLTNSNNTIVRAPIINLTSTTGDIELRVPNNQSVHLGNRHISALADPTAAQHAATKNYVDTKFASVPQPDLSPYATKQLLQETQEALKTRIDNNQNLINQNIEDIGLKANANNVVDLTSNQNIEGEKRFNGICRVARTPTVDLMIANKKYVDELVNSKTLKVVEIPKAEVSLTRVNSVGAADEAGEYVKWESANEQAISIVWEQLAQRYRPIAIHFRMSRIKVVVSDITVIDDSSRRLLFKLPAFPSPNDIPNFFNKNWIDTIKISTAG